MMRAIWKDETPNLLVLQYSNDWLVSRLLLVHKAFFSESAIERRPPLSPTARRAGWVGCNILLDRIPPDGKILVVSDGLAVPMEEVRREFARVSRLSVISPTVRGWTLDVLNAIRRLGKTRFSLTELYEVEGDLQALHPANRNVRPKMRQQLQVLRDLGFVRFISPGEYLLAQA
jgi:type II restriction enzyme